MALDKAAENMPTNNAITTKDETSNDKNNNN